MKLTKQGLALGFMCLIQAVCYAIRPVDGIYAGVIIGPTASQTIKFNINPSQISQTTIDQDSSTLEQVYGITVPSIESAQLPNKQIPGNLTYSVLGGVGGSVGYKFFRNWRAEGEFFYNNNPFKQLTVGNVIVTNSKSDPLYIKGDTNYFTAMANFYHDFLISSRDNYAALVPFWGTGIGYLYQENTLTFNTPDSENSLLKLKGHKGAIAAQEILGINYFMDDFCWISIDIRYTTTFKKEQTSAQPGMSFSGRPQVLSVMFGFQGVIEHG